MLTFQNMYEAAQKGANDESTDSLTFLKQQINVGLHLIEDELGSFYTDDTSTDTTVASQAEYETPARFLRFKEVYVTVSSVRYPVEEIYDESLWQRIKSRASSQTSDIPQYIFSRSSTYELYPTPTSSSNTITMIYEASNKDLTKANYNTGTITTLANGSKAVTGSSTVWSTGSNAVAGEYFKIDADGVWYKITTVGSDTSITLTKKYEGTSIAAGTSAYTIGEIPRIPASIHMLPVFYALNQYFMLIKVDGDKSKDYWDMFVGQGKYQNMGLEAARSRWGKRYSSGVIKGSRRRRYGQGIINPNFYPTNMS